MPGENMPAAEVDVDERLVRRLLAAQHPDLAGRSLVLFANGWDNVMYRLGADLVVRLPRRQVAAVLVDHEQRWLPILAPRLPLPIPAPVRIGRPGDGYPWSWSVIPWLPGRIAAETGVADPATEARRLGAFVAALHQPAPADAPVNPVRGGPLADRAFAVDERLSRLASVVDTEAVARTWARCVATRPWSGPPLWLHGDLHTANVLVDSGAISAVIDFGDITAGDPATDLAIAWMLFGGTDRDGFRATCGTNDGDTWDRARGWALHLGLAYLAHSADNPLMATVGGGVIRAVLDDEA
ncbi:MAG TPA: aminoglycoside phosphotransferase family protein [Acidimicrobiales bacterium]|nr:aminoglycoside phosphotransferase family protein [Acidimicrobiales bacterium]